MCVGCVHLFLTHNEAKFRAFFCEILKNNVFCCFSFMQTRMSVKSLEAQCVAPGAVRILSVPTGVSCSASLACLMESVVSD